MTDEWTPERPNSPWMTREPWHFLSDDLKQCQFHGEYVAKLVRAHIPADWDEKLKRMSEAERRAVKPLFQDWWTRCPKCDDTIHKEQVEMNHEIIEGEEERRELRKMRALTAGVPPKYADAEVQDLRPLFDRMKRAVAEVKNYCMGMDINLQSGRNLALLGKVGTGKTHSAAVIANHCLAKGLRVCFTTEAAMLTHVKSSWDKDTKMSESQAKDDFVNSDLLIIDEFGRYARTEHDERILGEIVNARDAANRPMVFTANLNEKEMKRSLGEAGWSRIGNNLTKVGFTWQDLRAEGVLNQ